MSPEDTQPPGESEEPGPPAAGPLSDSPGELAREALIPAEEAPPAAPHITFRGNSYDLLSLGALISGALVLFTCLTCGAGAYCLPLLPVGLGAIGLLGARQAVDLKRTRLWSWLGIGAGALILLIGIVGILLYIGFIALMIVASEGGQL
jgi:hypothetical protein